jgi:ectoine hydroxylase-related dioxygenase (phytanoyl-CoA dioxygenase family)
MPALHWTRTAAAAMLAATSGSTGSMPAPLEFTPDHVARNSPRDEQLYTAFLRSGEPYRSLVRTNFHAAARLGFAHDPAMFADRVPVPGIDLDDTSLYHNTDGEAQDYWRGVDLPRPTKDIRRLRQDLGQWGYCLIEHALSQDQLARMKQRLDAQAEGERLPGIACWTGTAPAPGEALPRVQFVHALINKGRQFIQCVEHDPEGVQAGPVIEQLLNETMGRDFLMSSFLAIRTSPFNNPQGLHIDQATAPFVDSAAPFTVNTMFLLDDTSAHNGGTLVVPGSHRLLAAAGSGKPLAEPLPPAINLTAPAGTVMIFEGRLLHGTGVNRSQTSRTILVMNSVKPYMRQQELHLLSALPEVLANASPKLLYRLGARPTGLGGIEGAWNGEYLVQQRLAMDAGRYLRVGELSPESTPEVLGADYGYRYAETAQWQAAHQPDTAPSIRARHAGRHGEWQAPAAPKFPQRPPPKMA